MSAHSSRLRPAIPPLEIIFEPSWEEEREGGREGRRKEEMGRERSSLVVPDPSVDVLRSICCDDLLLTVLFSVILDLLFGNGTNSAMIVQA